MDITVLHLGTSSKAQSKTRRIPGTSALRHATRCQGVTVRMALVAAMLIVLPAIGESSMAIGMQPVAEWVKDEMESLTALYLHLHRHPELSFEEKETAARLAQELSDAGLEVTRNVGGHGVVAVLANGAGPTVLIRADMDALPVEEQTQQPYASTVKSTDRFGRSVGVMHACGHDVHMTCLVGAARFLAAHKTAWSGTIVCIGQPAEERGTGAEAMIKDGLFEQFPKPDFALALHVFPELPAGKMAVRAGFIMANVDSVDVTMHGRGGHGAFPHLAIDPVILAARFIVDLQTIVSREIDPTEPAVISVGSIHAGTKHNIISDSCELQLTVRSYSNEVRQQLLDAIRRKAKAAADSSGANEPTIRISDGTPALFNDPSLVERLRPSFENALGREHVVEGKPVMGSEDFSQYALLGNVPSVMFALGAVDARRITRYQQLKIVNPPLHSAEFYPDFEPTINTGIIAMTSAVMHLLPLPTQTENQ